jgi:hypothetical protein
MPNLKLQYQNGFNSSISNYFILFFKMHFGTLNVIFQYFQPAL